MVFVLDSSNPLAFGVAFFDLMFGIMLVTMGAVKDKGRKTEQAQTRTEIVEKLSKLVANRSVLKVETSGAALTGAGSSSIQLASPTS